MSLVRTLRGGFLDFDEALLGSLNLRSISLLIHAYRKIVEIRRGERGWKGNLAMSHDNHVRLPSRKSDDGIENGGHHESNSYPDSFAGGLDVEYSDPSLAKNRVLPLNQAG